MGRPPCCCCGLKTGRWTEKEDQVLIKFVQAHGQGNWPSVSRTTGLQRCRKSCRLRWMNHLRSELKKGNIEPDEEKLIIELHEEMGNKWSFIAGKLPGRNDNEIKNYWNNHLRKKRERQETDHNANNAQSLEKNKKHDIKNKSKMRICGGLDDKLEDDDDFLGLEFLNDGKLEKIYEQFSEILSLDVSQLGFYSSFLEDLGLDFLDDGKLEKIREELSELLKEDESKCS